MKVYEPSKLLANYNLRILLNHALIFFLIWSNVFELIEGGHFEFKFT